MGTSFSIKVSQLPKTVAHEALVQQIDELLSLLNRQMSTYLPDSELSLFNSSQSTEWQPASPALFQVLAEAKRVNKQSRGAFDVTVGPLVNLWGFGPDPISFVAPPEDQIAAKLHLIGSNHLFLQDDGLAIRKDIPQLYLDLSALAKGYAVDRVALLLEQQGIENYLVEIGGEIRLKGVNIQGKPWRIAVEKPAADSRMIQKVLPVSDICMATSGDYRNFFEVDGVRFSHTIDPRTGRPITHKLASVTVLSQTTMTADAWATALTVLGPVQGFELAQQKNIAALFIIKTDAGFMEKSTSAFNDFFEVKS
ncbi:FAD:protein FMN transferase [Methylomarinum vadi]|uniref:FAD:protein FMN transferase n=1 Tax=Methylomarinum vadi TaxID=438855 RepID=UPI0004DF4499|nr:FAD:protein FMN transferase [Methylomarinum vadi]